MNANEGEKNEARIAAVVFQLCLDRDVRAMLETATVKVGVMFGWGPECAAMYVANRARDLVEDMAETERGVVAGYSKKPIPKWMRAEVFERDGFACVKCGDTDYLVADHKYPERDGGPTHPDNLQTLCATCNVRKGSSRDYDGEIHPQTLSELMGGVE